MNNKIKEWLIMISVPTIIASIACAFLMLSVAMWDAFLPTAPTQITYYVDNCEDLDNMRNDLNGIYIQTADIDCRGYGK